MEALKSNKMKLTVNVTQGFLTINLKDEIVTFKQDTSKLNYKNALSVASDTFSLVNW